MKGTELITHTYIRLRGKNQTQNLFMVCSYLYNTFDEAKLKKKQKTSQWLAEVEKFMLINYYGGYKTMSVSKLRTTF
jgi:helix-turn-helix protein